jgi:hypothetical protein
MRLEPACALAVLLAACAGPGSLRDEPEAPSPDLPPRVAESSLPREEIEAIPEPGTPGSPIVAAARDGEAAAPAAAQEAGAGEAGEREGFRVQIFASPVRFAAESAAEKARGSFRDEIHVDHQPPLYKVRVGDFLTRDEALEARDQAVAAGYRDAWIVECSVERRGGR